MEQIEESKNLINQSENIYLIPAENTEAISSALALFYTLKDLGKNVNIITENFPENLKFLLPDLNFISYPKNFVISIPNKVANVSQVFYEKNEEAVKIHLTVESGNIKKDNISFYFSETKPDLIITVGVDDYLKDLDGRLNSFGFLLDSPILNIDSSQNNKKFGKINLVEDSPLSETVFSLIKEIAQSIKKEAADSLLASIIIFTDNFQKNISAEIFQDSSLLMNCGADFKNISEKLKLKTE